MYRYFHSIVLNHSVLPLYLALPWMLLFKADPKRRSCLWNLFKRRCLAQPNKATTTTQPQFSIPPPSPPSDETLQADLSKQPGITIPTLTTQMQDQLIEDHKQPMTTKEPATPTTRRATTRATTTVTAIATSMPAPRNRKNPVTASRSHALLRIQPLLQLHRISRRS
ncbi:MAG: hypothetical protein J3R72DRAFT_458392 [Linnemannia gamsii]|nr:MAG: hypothetical protein J3R72DRAFT_458392 [Linnemannia gamsii]